MIVRLKVFFRELYKYTIKKFQFYDSPIKSLSNLYFKEVFFISFQFYDSPIKSLYNTMSMEIPYNMFQFYDSPIKSIPSLYHFVVNTSFNSMIVRLKERN